MHGAKLDKKYDSTQKVPKINDIPSRHLHIPAEMRSQAQSDVRMHQASSDELTRRIEVL